MNPIHPKVAAATGGTTFGGALALVLVWALNRYANAQIDPTVAMAIGTVFSGVLCFVRGYLKPSTPAT